MEVRIRKYGEKMNSRIAERRNLYLEIQPSSLPDVISALRNLEKLWEYKPPYFDTWYRYQPCKHCVERAKYELEKFSKGEWYWNRRWCFRHYLVEHLDDILDYDNVISSNRHVDFYMSKPLIQLTVGSRNYRYHIELNRQYATMIVDYKGTRYAFKYNNHTNALPFASSYTVLLHELREVGRYFAEFLEDVRRVKEKGGCVFANIYINGELFLTPCSR